MELTHDDKIKLGLKKMPVVCVTIKGYEMCLSQLEVVLTYTSDHSIRFGKYESSMRDFLISENYIVRSLTEEEEWYEFIDSNFKGLMDLGKYLDYKYGEEVDSLDREFSISQIID